MKSSPSPSIARWELPSSTTLGSSVRAKGIERELRRRLPWPMRKCLNVEGRQVILEVADPVDLQPLESRIASAIEVISEMPLLPSEVEDVLAICSRERHKWLEDGRLQSAGTRTVKLRGRARAVTFHVFEPRHIETILDGDLPAIWREEDAIRSSENRRRAAAKAALAGARRAESRPAQAAKAVAPDKPPDLRGWDEFDADGLLR
ncbi:hypothetical protein [Bosea sp. BH3]|uniref:hypothetical protein n=1 Tax=Bosea sp. BH3 TaxID=2871701 RepID=UPI0021CAFCE0|nr:hypothetical protein [Bosea sp. BH3]MCU4180147.1 hypothetical protein [Bosea sp. BH3]